MKTVVLMGGPSGEHEISLKSGQGIVEALRHRGMTAEPLMIPRTLGIEAAAAWTSQALHAAAADIAFIALHGTFGEDGTMQQVCETLHVAYTGSDAAASRLGMDKVASRRRFEAAGLSVPRWAVMDAESASSQLPRGFAWPVVVKPVSQGSSLGVSLVRQAGQLPAALQAAGRYGRQVLVEEFIQGRELTVGILGDDPLPVVEIRPHEAFFDFTAKYTPGATDYLAPAPIDVAVARQLQAAALSAHRALGCRHLSRSDFILRARDEGVLLEINTIPGFTPTSLLPKAAACVGISYDALCERVALMAWEDRPAAAVA